MTENLFKRILTPVRLRKSDIGGRVPLEEFFSDKSRIICLLYTSDAADE